MKLADFNKLKKLMQMTMSGADAEKLFSINKANALLIAEGVDWNRVLDRMVKLDVETAPADDHFDKSEAQLIDEAFATIEASDPRGSFATFIADLKEKWDQHRRLTDGQKAALFKAEEKCR